MSTDQPPTQEDEHEMHPPSDDESNSSVCTAHPDGERIWICNGAFRVAPDCATAYKWVFLIVFCSAVIATSVVDFAEARRQGTATFVGFIVATVVTLLLGVATLIFIAITNLMEPGVIPNANHPDVDPATVEHDIDKTRMIEIEVVQASRVPQKSVTDNNSPSSEQKEQEHGDDVVAIKTIPWEQKVCATCHIWRPPRSGHSSSSGTCVDCYDHHCIILGATISGATNWKYFFWFNVSAVLFATCGIATCVASLVVLIRWNRVSGSSLLQWRVASAVLMILIGALPLYLTAMFTCRYCEYAMQGVTAKDVHNANDAGLKLQRARVQSPGCGECLRRVCCC